MPQIFISHSHHDIAVVRELDQLLNAVGVATWYSTRDIKTSEEWNRMIRRGLKSSDWFLVVLTPEAIKSEWVETELHWWFKRDLKPIIPLLVKSCEADELDLRLGRFQHLDARKGVGTAIDDLLALLGTGTPARRADPGPAQTERSRLGK